MKILLLGSNGMLGQAIRKQLKKDGSRVIGIDRLDSEYCFDLLNDERIEQCMDEVQPDIVINTAAIVNLELCEKDHGGAYCINGRLPGILAALCSRYHSYLIHVSTDHFYCGDGSYQHKEKDPIVLMNEYARTKYIGEQMALTCEDSVVLRTNIVGFRGSGQQTFVEWCLSEIQKKAKMTLFTDFYTSSIHTADFARILSDLIRVHPKGILNLASSEVSNKEHFVLKLADEVLGYRPDYICGSVKTIKGAPRGGSLGLDTGRIKELLGYRMPTLDETIQSIRNEYEERKMNNEI